MLMQQTPSRRCSCLYLNFFKPLRAKALISEIETINLSNVSMWDCGLHIKLNNSRKFHLFNAVIGERIRELIICWPCICRLLYTFWDISCCHISKSVLLHTGEEPLPSETTIRDYFKSFKMVEGHNKPLFKLLKMKAETLEPKQRVVSISLDGVHTRRDISYCPSEDRIIGPHNEALVVMIRGVFFDFKIPIWWVCFILYSNYNWQPHHIDILKLKNLPLIMITNASFWGLISQSSDWQQEMSHQVYSSRHISL